MDTEILAAAILAAGFTIAQRQPLNTGRLDDTIREKFIEYYVFVRQETANARKKKKKKKATSG